MASAAAKLIAFLLFWLTITAARLAFDLIGRLWLAVAFNLCQLLAQISGLFGAAGRRRSLLIALAVTNLFSVGWNVLLIVFYSHLFGEKSLLSAGLPHGFSFFVKHTPFCAAFFNVTAGCWDQEASCVLPYDVVERIQAAVHILLALLTTVFAVLVARRRPLAEKSANLIRPPPQSTTGFLNVPCEDPRVSTALKKTPRTATNEIRANASDDFSSAATAEVRSESGSSAEVRRTRSTARRKKPSALPPPAHSRCCSEHPPSPQPPPTRSEFDSDDYVAARLASTHETAAAFPPNPRQNSAVRSRSLISFDPKRADPLRRISHDDSDDETTTDERNYGELPLVVPQPPSAVPSVRAPLPPPLPPPLPTAHTPPGPDSGLPSTTQSGGSPDLSRAGVPLATPIYEHVRSRLDSSTAFPVFPHARQHAYGGVSISTAIPLRQPMEQRHVGGYERLSSRLPPPSFHHRRRSSDQSDCLPPPPPALSRPLAPPDFDGGQLV